MSPSLPRYAEVLPPAPLREWVACLWEIRGDLPLDAPAAHRVLPDGCVDLILEPGRPSAAQLVGPMSTAALVPFAGPLDTVGLRLRPGGHGLVAALEAGALVDLAIEPAAAGAATRRLAAAVALAVEPPAPLAVRAARVWAALLPLASSTGPREPLLAHALRRWSTEDPAPAVRELVRDTGVSERTLERRLARAAGFRPAELRRLVRFRRVLRLRAAGERPWGTLAAEAGYADQAHLVREFRRFVGLSPSRWAAEQARAGFVQDGSIAAL